MIPSPSQWRKSLEAQSYAVSHLDLSPDDDVSEYDLAPAVSTLTTEVKPWTEGNFAT